VSLVFPSLLLSVCDDLPLTPVHSLQCVDISNDASLVAAGFSDSIVRLWSADQTRGIDDEGLYAEKLFPDGVPAAAGADGVSAASATAAADSETSKKCVSVGLAARIPSSLFSKMYVLVTYARLVYVCVSADGYR